MTPSQHRLELIRDRARHRPIDRPISACVLEALRMIQIREATPPPDQPPVAPVEPEYWSSWRLIPPPRNAAPEQRRMLAAVVLIG
jgi:hypothetical protein